MLIKPKFPDHRLRDPKRRAELAIYRELEASTTPGVVLYEPRFGPYSRGLDFAAWLEGIGRFGIEGKGGHHSVKDAAWYLSTPSGQVEIDCPALQAWDGSMAFRDRIAVKKGRGPFIVPVVIFPDMEPDARIAAKLADSPAHAIFGVEDLTGQLSRLTHVKHKPTAADIERETALVRGVKPETETPGLPALDLHSGQVVIQHVDTVNVYNQFPAPLAEGARMDGADRIRFGHYLLDRVEVDRHALEIGGLLAARWGSGAFAHALMAYSGEEMTTEVPASMYAAAARLDREAGGGEWWRQAAYAAYEISHAFYSGGLPADELERKTEVVVQGARELLARLEAAAP